MKRAVHWLLAIGLAISVAANALLFEATKTFYAREARFRLHPAGTPSFKETGAPDLPKVLLLGDSRIAHWKDFATDKFHATNAGVGNETTAQILLRAQTALDRARPSVLVLEAGINDLKVIPLMPGKKREIADECVNNLMAMAKLAGLHGAKTVVLSVLPAGKVGWAQRLVWSDSVGESVRNVNRELAERCHNEPSVRFVDLSSEPQIGRDYVDTLHFNEAFYRRITPLVTQGIETVRSK